MIRPATTRVILGFDSSNSLQEVSFVKSTAVTDTDVSIERVNLALYDSYVVTGPNTTSVRLHEFLSSRKRPSSAIGMTFVFSVCRLVSRRCHSISALHRLCLKPSQNRTKGFSLSGSSFNHSASQKGSG